MFELFLFFSLSVVDDPQNGANNFLETDFDHEQDDAFAGANEQVLTTMKPHEIKLIQENMEHLISHTSKSNLEYVVSALSDFIPEEQRAIFKVTLVHLASSIFVNWKFDSSRLFYF